MTFNEQATMATSTFGRDDLEVLRSRTFDEIAMATARASSAR
jgi:hypothetical protein